MRQSGLFWFLNLIFFNIHAQSVISGTVRDGKNKPLHGVSLAIEGSYDGGITDSLGQFKFTTTEKGNQVLTASIIGYKPFQASLVLNGSPQSLSINLKEQINELKAVVITAGSFEAGDKKRGTVLSSLDILTTASANADVTGAIRTLPGAQQVGESSGLFVRGGTAEETKIFIDGTLVNNFFYSSLPDIASRGRFSPFIFKGTVFSAGGYSALYGQALSSALILESTDMPDLSSANLGISPIGVNAGIQKLSKNKKFAWGANYSYTNVLLAFDVLRPNVDYFTIPEYHTADADFRVKTSATGILKYYGFFSLQNVGVRRPNIDTLGYKSAFGIKDADSYHNLSWHESIGKGWKLNAGLSYSNTIDHLSGDLQDQENNQVTLGGLEYENFRLRTTENYWNSKLVLEKKLAGLSTIRFGGEYNYANKHYYFTSYSGQAYDYPVIEHMKAAFAESDIYITNNLAAKAGVRFEHSSLLNKANIAPRVSLAYKLGDESQASLAYGNFYEDPDFKYLPSPSPLNFEEATHYIAQYQKMGDGKILRIEAYYKKYIHLIKTAGQYTTQQVAINNNGSGEADGIELFMRDKKTIRNFDYWVSYTYLNTKRDFLNFPYSMQPNFASKHTASVVVKRFFTKLKTEFNASYTFATPRPYYDLLYDGNGKFTIGDKGMTPDYNSLSLSVDYLPKVFKSGAGKSTVFVLSVTNVLGSNQVFGYNYSYNGYHKEAITPPVKTFVYIGAFFSFGVDRSEDVINSNL